MRLGLVGHFQYYSDDSKEGLNINKQRANQTKR
jgi:hypothetical protein